MVEMKRQVIVQSSSTAKGGRVGYVILEYVDLLLVVPVILLIKTSVVWSGNKWQAQILHYTELE